MLDRDSTESGENLLNQKGPSSHRSDLLSEERRTEMSGPGSSSHKLGLNQSLKTISGLSQDLVVNTKAETYVGRSIGMLNAIAAASMDENHSTGSGDGAAGGGDGGGGASTTTTNNLFIWESLGRYVF